VRTHADVDMQRVLREIDDARAEDARAQAAHGAAVSMVWGGMAIHCRKCLQPSPMLREVLSIQ
jgi:hypothetical protein